MAETNLTQPEADALIAIEKHRVIVDRTDFPLDGQHAPAKPSSQILFSSPLQPFERLLHASLWR